MPKPAQISIPHSVVSASEPDVSQMADGELALNRASGRLYFKNSFGDLDYFANFTSVETLIVDIFDDTVVGTNTTWSSDKIQDELNDKSDVGHDHDINEIQNLQTELNALQTELNALQTATSTAPLTRIRYRSLQDQGSNPSLYQHIEASTSSSAYNGNWTFDTSSPGFTQTWNINNFHVDDGAPEDIRAIYVSIKWRVGNTSLNHRTVVSTRYPFFLGDLWFPLLADETAQGLGQANAGVVRIPVFPQHSNQFQLNYRTLANTGDIESQIIGVECHEQIQISV